MRKYETRDVNGTWEFIDQDNGVSIGYLKKPSAEYLAKFPLPGVDLAGGPRDLPAEIDALTQEIAGLKGLVEQLQSS